LSNYYSEKKSENKVKHMILHFFC